MLTESELIRRLRSSESHWAERKPPDVNAREIRIQLVAFANSISEGQWAVLFIGVDNRGKPVGVLNADQKQKDVTKIAESECYPPVKCEPTVLQIEGAEVVAVVIGFSQNRPHFTGHAYVRAGSESKKASSRLFEDLIASRNDKVRRLLDERGNLLKVAWGSRDVLPGRFEAQLTPLKWLVQNCVVLRCDPCTLELEDAKTGAHAHIPIKWITLGKGGGAARRQIFVESRSSQ